MGTNNLNNRSSGETIVQAFFNDIHTAMNSDFVGRNSSGVPTSGQSLGTAAFPWGTARLDGLVVGGSTVDVSQVSASPFRVVSGTTRSGSNQPAYLDPAGSAGGASVTLLATTTNLVIDINGVAVSITSDIVKSGLTLAPSSNNTALVNDSDAADEEVTRRWGEASNTTTGSGKIIKNQITIDTIGSAISAKDGELAAFKINDGANDEFFLCRIDTTNNRLHQCFRGFFYDSSINPINRLKFANNDTITLLSLGFFFIDSDGSTLDVTFNEPVYDFTQPSGVVTGDYWFDLGTTLWKRFDGASFITVNRTFIGYVALDDTDALGCRSVDFDANFKTDNTLELELFSTSIAKGRNRFSKINVQGIEIDYVVSQPLWNITTDLAGSADMYDATEQASREYHFYVKDTGEEVISDISPYIRPDLRGKFHPHNPWRWCGSGFNNSSSDFTIVGDEVRKDNIGAIYNESTTVMSTGGVILDFPTKHVDTHDAVTTGASWKFIAPNDGIYELIISSSTSSSASTDTIQIIPFADGIQIAPTLAAVSIKIQNTTNDFSRIEG